MVDQEAARKVAYGDKANVFEMSTWKFLSINDRRTFPAIANEGPRRVARINGQWTRVVFQLHLDSDKRREDAKKHKGRR